MKKSRLRSRIGACIIACILLGGSFLMSCKDQFAKSKGAGESFEHFFSKFHSDSLFQMERIRFPLPGINTDEMAMDDTIYYWEAENWKMHHDVNLDTTDFIVERNISDSLTVEKIYEENTGFIIERTFEKIDGRWYLVYYKDVNL